MFFSKLTKPEVQNSCQKYYKGVVGQRRGNNRLQNSPYFCVFKYALAVKQKERVTDFFTVLKKNDCFAVYGNKRICWITSLSAESMYDW